MGSARFVVPSSLYSFYYVVPTALFVHRFGLEHNCIGVAKEKNSEDVQSLELMDSKQCVLFSCMLFVCLFIMRLPHTKSATSIFVRLGRYRK